MADPSPAGGMTGGLFKKLGPKGKRYAAAVAIAAVLALIVLLGRRNKALPPAEVDPNAAPADAPGDLGQPVPLGDPPFQPQSTFADNGEAAGTLSSAITEGLSQVGSALTDEQQALTDLNDKLTGTPVTAPGPLGQTGGGKNKSQAAQLAKQKKKIADQKRRIGQLKKQDKKPDKKPAPKAPAGGGGNKKKKKK